MKTRGHTVTRKHSGGIWHLGLVCGCTATRPMSAMEQRQAANRGELPEVVNQGHNAIAPVYVMHECTKGK